MIRRVTRRGAEEQSPHEPPEHDPDHDRYHDREHARPKPIDADAWSEQHCRAHAGGHRHAGGEPDLWVVWMRFHTTSYLRTPRPGKPYYPTAAATPATDPASSRGLCALRGMRRRSRRPSWKA